jgi:hypothetical protein
MLKLIYCNKISLAKSDHIKWCLLYNKNYTDYTLRLVNKLCVDYNEEISSKTDINFLFARKFFGKCDKRINRQC